MSNQTVNFKPGAPVAKRCSACGAVFECGINQESCWCSQLPLLPAERLDPDRDCLCKACLEASINAGKGDSA